MLDAISRQERRQLLEFVCSFAWADLEIQPEERTYVEKVLRMLEIPREEREEVRGWLERPPAPEEVDPNSIPPEHRELFVKAVEGVVAADREFTAEERDMLVLFKRLLAGG